MPETPANLDFCFRLCSCLYNCFRITSSSTPTSCESWEQQTGLRYHVQACAKDNQHRALALLRACRSTVILLAGDMLNSNMF